MAGFPRVQRRFRDGEGHRQRRVNLRLSEAEHAELQRAATVQSQTLAGYAAAAALPMARDDLPPSLAVMMVRLFSFRSQQSHLLAALKSARPVPDGEQSPEMTALLARPGRTRRRPRT